MKPRFASLSRAATLALAAAAGTLILPASVLSAHHAENPAPRQQRLDCPNAAVNYLFAAEAIRATGRPEQFGDIDWASIEGITQWDELPAHVREAADAVPAQAIQAFLTGSRIECCQFYIDRREGPYMLMTHLGYMRQVARVVRLDARAQLAQGNVEAAAERLAGLYRMSMHLSSDETLIGSLVGLAIAAFAHSEAAEFLTSGRATPEARRILAEALERMDDDPFGLRAAIRGERDGLLEWVRREFRGDDAGARLVKELSAAWDAAAVPDLFRHGVELLDEAGLHREVDRLQRYYDQVEQLWDAPGATERIEALDARLQAGEFGLLTVFAPSFGKARSSADRAEEQLARTLELLSAEEEGQP